MRIYERPFRSPHSSSSMPSLIGGGRNAIPGELTLAHLGVLFLDELPEFNKLSLEALRQPIEEKNVTISRVNSHVTYPCNVLLIAAMNPCKCGYFGYNSNMECHKAPSCAIDYQNKISGPLFDRFDIQVNVDAMHILDIQRSRNENGEDSRIIAKRVEQARLRQITRFKQHNIISNSELTDDLLDKYISLDEDGYKLLDDAISKFHLSMRAISKVIKVARTISDLDGNEKVDKLAVAEALTYRIHKEQ